ncbi:MAG: HlyD family efflux transporter periplasmic adaptor subunit [Chlorobi bacterium]|nr:HlyD family efflux transporter periplasmic adaptor subunit [Chlorobiota bacterium]
MKRAERMNSSRWFATVTMLAALAGGLGGCTNGDAAVSSAIAARTEVRDGGRTIRLAEPPAPDGPIQTGVLREGVVKAEVIAPASAVAGISRSTGGGGRIALFASGDMTSLYSAFTQNQTALDKATRDLARRKDLFEHQAATGKDVSDAETDLANARATVAETEGKIRAAGFNPEELRTGRPGMLWLISDVPESQLYEVRRGEETSIEFSSFPGERFTGRVQAIGDVIDNATRTVKVRIAMTNAGERLKPGMFAKVNFGQSESRVISIPQSAIVIVQGKHYVFASRSATEFERREIQPGRQIGDSIIVAGGLNAGDVIATQGAMLLKGLSFGY